MDYVTLHEAKIMTELYSKKHPEKKELVRLSVENVKNIATVAPKERLTEGIAIPFSEFNSVISALQADGLNVHDVVGVNINRMMFIRIRC